MGVHFTFTFDHDFTDTSVVIMRRRFQSLESTFHEIARHWSVDYGRPGRSPEPWQDVSEVGSERPRHLFAPAGLSLLVGPAAAKFHHFSKFHPFIHNRRDRAVLRRLAYEVASLFGSEQVIYAPCEGTGDEIADLLTEGLQVEDIETKLAEHGPAAQTIEELDSVSWPQPRYYVDIFDDFRENGANRS